MPRRRFLKAWSSPKDFKISDARECIDRIATMIKKKRDFKRAVGIQVSEVFVGGSIGQGTTVPGHYDADLVVYSRDIHHKDVVREGYKSLHDKVKQYLEEHLGSNYIPQDGTQFAIKFEYRFSDDNETTLEVDLLFSPYWSNHEEFLRGLGEVDIMERQMFSASASKYQVKFIKYLHETQLDISRNQCSKVIELIRRAKSWRNKSWTVNEDGKLMLDERGRPKSYLICLLVITAFVRVPYHGMPFRRLAERVGEEMKTLLHEITLNDQLDLVIPGTDPIIREKYSHLLPPHRLRIPDPVNPATNLYLNGVVLVSDKKKGKERNKEKWALFEEKIQSIDLTVPVSGDQRNIHTDR